jgi:LPXTG-motif cell wall-anchored protein
MQLRREGTATLANMPARIVCLAAALIALGSVGALAPSAFAQGAGDEQYADPIVRDGREPAPEQAPDSSAGTDGRGSGVAPSTGSSTEATEPRQTSPSDATATLPRTGVDAGLLAALGLALLLAGSLARWRSARRAGA